MTDPKTPQNPAPEAPPSNDPAQPAQVPAQNPETDRLYNYTPATLQAVKAVLSTGGTRTAAMQYAGITRETFYRWLKIVPEFKAIVEKAEAECRVYVESALWKNIRAGSGPDIRFYLRSRCSEDWQQVDTVVNQKNITNINNHAESVKKARERVAAKRAAAGPTGI
jgi:hypothetical protein